MRVDKKISKYLGEGHMGLRLMNYENDLRQAQQKIKDIQQDIVTISVRGDAPNKLDADGMKQLNKLVSDLDIIDIKMAYVRGMLKQLKLAVND